MELTDDHKHGNVTNHVENDKSSAPVQIDAQRGSIEESTESIKVGDGCENSRGIEIKKDEEKVSIERGNGNKNETSGNENELQVVDVNRVEKICNTDDIAIKCKVKDPFVQIICSKSANLNNKKVRYNEKQQFILKISSKYPQKI